VRLEDLGLIGNCQYAALVSRAGEVVWACLPRFDAEPVFARLLDDERGGRFLVGPASGGDGESRYIDNTNVLETRFENADGAFRVIDFAPRFLQYDRSFRPTQLVRIVEPLAGAPRIRAICEPRLGWSGGVPPMLQGSNHVQWDGFGAPLRLTTDLPLSYLGGRDLLLSEKRHMVLTWGAPIEEALPQVCDRFLTETLRYWRRWVKHCNVPPEYQDDVIRSALALKLHCFEDTGAIVAATTTSIVEAPGSGRNWDYRYCWLRDAFYVLDALRLLGHFEERERFTSFLLDLAANAESDSGLVLRPLYRVDGGSDLDEHVLADWNGYAGERPVRIGNGAARQNQHDVFGEMVLALAPIFLDERFREERTSHALALVERLARRAIAVAGTPDAGIWEQRIEPQTQSFSSLMCWAAADRMARIKRRVAPQDAAEFADAAARIHHQVIEHAFDAARGSFVSTYGGKDLDAALLQMVPLRFLPRDDPRLVGTVDAIARVLARDGWLLRYDADDGFGAPTVAFTICTFWLVEALARLGRKADARALYERVRVARSPLGLLSEDYDPVNHRLWGNFPQAYSHVGMIHAAFAASPTWDDVV
jgi:GH15 family glucan-1,4-alpha-glucosidase